MLKERERKLLEKKTQILRLYLIENVIPKLSQGLIEVGKEMPEDPIEYLADYLMKQSKETLNFSRHSNVNYEDEK